MNKDIMNKFNSERTGSAEFTAVMLMVIVVVTLVVGIFVLGLIPVFEDKGEEITDTISSIHVKDGEFGTGNKH